MVEYGSVWFSMVQCGSVWFAKKVLKHNVPTGSTKHEKFSWKTSLLGSACSGSWPKMGRGLRGPVLTVVAIPSVFKWHSLCNWVSWELHTFGSSACVWEEL